MLHSIICKDIALGICLLAIAGGILGFSEYRYHGLKQELSGTKQELAITTSGLQQKITELETTIANENKNLANKLGVEQDKNNSLSSAFSEIKSTVGTLEKLSKTDSELLKKYSKVYFLNEHYIPTALSKIDPKYLYDKNKALEIHLNVYPYLLQLIDAAGTDGKILQVISAYRSFGMQSQLKSAYAITYGAGTANQFSADQGYSEHQLGTTLDFTTREIGSTFSGFDKTPEYAWLIANAYKYGFVISYPDNNSYYKFEPWHWRFVGTALAKRLHDDNKYFYDMDQRDIDSYLVNIFD